MWSFIVYYLLAFGFAGLVIKVILLESIIFDKKYKAVILYVLSSSLYGVLFIMAYSTANNMPLPW